MKFATVDDGIREGEVFSRVFNPDLAQWQHFSDYDGAAAAIEGGELDYAELVLLDMQMDDDDEAGLRLAQALCGRGIKGNVVILSVSENQEMVCSCIKSGASAYVVKPGDRDDLEVVVESLKALGPHARKCLPLDCQLYG